MSQAHKDYFNRLAEEWHARMPDEPGLRDLLVRFGVTAGERILDVGAGTGRMSRHLIDLAGEDGCVVAEDIAVRMLLDGKGRMGRPPLWVCDDVTDLAFQDGVFDRIVCFSAFPHFIDPARALQELNRVLVAGGRLLILHTRSSRDLNAFHATLDGVVSDDVLPDGETLSRWIEDAGLLREEAFDEDGFYWVTAMKP